MLTDSVTDAGRERRAYLAIALVVPILGASLGVNGGAIFQIIAIENLGLNARQIGLAVGLGALSIPFQIWAARIPLRYAIRNMALFVIIMAVFCWLMALLILGPDSDTFVVVSVISIAVLAELALSVLFATSWQPLLSTNVSHEFRQRLNAQARAASSLILIGIVTVVGWIGATGRVVVLVAIGCLGIGLVIAVGRLGSPPDELDEGSQLTDAARDADEQDRSPASGSLLILYIAIALSVVPAWPFFLTYAADAFWPSVNLGLVGAALTVGSLAVAAAWRPTATRLLARARIGTVVLLGCAVGLIPLERPVSGAGSGSIVLAIVALAAGAGTAVRMSLLEVAHRRSTPATSVRILTILDVVGSTAMQLSFLAAGYLISVSADSPWPVDPYQLSLIMGPAVLLVILHRFDSPPAIAPTLSRQ